eukprot:5933250-Pyramimonas_sp.AAC.1
MCLEFSTASLLRFFVRSSLLLEWRRALFLFLQVGSGRDGRVSSSVINCPVRSLRSARGQFSDRLCGTLFCRLLHGNPAEVFEEVIRADDLTAWRSLAADVAGERCLAILRQCQASLHAWGRANRV